MRTRNLEVTAGCGEKKLEEEAVIQKVPKMSVKTETETQECLAKRLSESDQIVKQLRTVIVSKDNEIKELRRLLDVQASQKHQMRQADDSEKKKKERKQNVKPGKKGEKSTGKIRRDVTKAVTGRVQWFNVKRGFGFIKRDDNLESVFVHFSGIKKNNPKKIQASLGDNEEVMFDIVKCRKGLQAANVTGPKGLVVKGSVYAKDRQPVRRRTQHQWVAHSGTPTRSSTSKSRYIVPQRRRNEDHVNVQAVESKEEKAVLEWEDELCQAVEKLKAENSVLPCHY